MRLREEDAQDLAVFDEAIARNEEAFPAAFVRELLDTKESRIMLYREYRGLSQDALGSVVGCSGAVVSQIEGGGLPVPEALLMRIAQALSVDPSDLI